MRRAALSVLGACVALILVTVFAVRAASPGTNPFVDAVSYFNPDSAVMKSYTMGQDATDPGPGFTPAAIWYEFCWPPTSGQTVPDIHGEFLVAPGGALTGSCVANTVDGTAHRESTLTGTYDLAAQTVEFHFDGSQTGIANPHVAKMSVAAPVTAVVGDRAEGIAPFTYTCTPGKGSDHPCTFASIEGTVMFAIQLQPTLPSEPPSTPQPPTPTEAEPTVAPVGPMQLSLACQSSPNPTELSTVNCTTSVTGAPSGTTLTYAWSMGGVQLSETGPRMQANAVVDGTYEVAVIATAQSGSVAPAAASQFLDVKEAGTGADDNSLVVIIILLILAGVGAAALVAIIRAIRRPKIQS